MKQTMMLTRRGRAFLAVLTEDAMTIETDGTDSSTKAESKKLLRSWGVDDYSIKTLQILYKAEDPQALLRSMRNKSLQAEQAKELFLLVQNIRRSSDKPLTGLIAEILKETIVMVPETQGRLVTYIHVPSYKDPNDSYFLSSSDVEPDYIQKKLMHRLETFLTTMLKDIKGGKPYVKILGDQLGIDNDSLDRSHPILNALQTFMDKTIRVGSIVLQLGAKLVEFKKNQACKIMEEGQGKLLQRYRDKKCVTVLFNNSLVHSDKEKRFSTETGRKDVNLPDGALQLPAKKDIDKARAYLKKLQKLKEDKQHQEQLVLKSAPASVALPKQQSVNLSLEGEKVERVRVLTPVVVVPVVVGLIVGAIIGANNIPAASMLPSALSAMGSIGFSVMVGASVGLALAIAGFCVAWCCIHEKDTHYKLLGTSSSDSLLPNNDKEEENEQLKAITIGEELLPEQKKRDSGKKKAAAKSRWFGVQDYTADDKDSIKQTREIG